MTNAELIAALRECANWIEAVAASSQYAHDELMALHYCDKLRDAADALEAAEKRIAQLEADLRDGTISNPERFKIYGYKLRDLILFADMCKRNDVQESDLKQAAWNLELAVRAYALEREEIIKNTMDKIVVRLTPDFEKAFEEMTKGEQE